MNKRIISALLTLCMVFSSFSIVVNADDTTNLTMSALEKVLETTNSKKEDDKSLSKLPTKEIFVSENGEADLLYDINENYINQETDLSIDDNFVSCDTVGASSGDCGENLKWNLDDAGILTISGTGEMWDYYSFSSAPWYSQRSKITNVVIENNVTSIGNCAFRNCTYITSIIMPESVERIGSRAFYSCFRIAEITIPAKVSSIGGSAFYGCSSIVSVTIPEAVTSIGGYAFYGCSAIVSVTIPEAVTSIGDFTFFNCTSLERVMMSSSVTSIGENAFYNCKSLASIKLPEKVITIGNFAFSGCVSLTNIEISDMVTSIGEKAFYDCRGVNSVTIPASAVDIGEYAFGYCSHSTTDYYKISSFTICCTEGSAGEIYAIENGFNYNAESIPISRWWSLDEYGTLTIYAVEGNEKMKDFSTETFAPWFDKRLNIKKIVVEHGVERIGNYAFRDMRSLVEITLPDTVTEIGDHAFVGCDSIENITIPNSVKVIGNYAFGELSSLVNLTISNSVVSIGDHAFGGCKSIVNLVIPKSVTEIGDYAFGGCKSIVNLVIPNSVVSIGDHAFGGCDSIVNLIIPNSVVSIGDYAFSGLTSLVSIKIPKNVTTMGEYAFSGCTSLKIANISSYIIGKYAFSGCTLLIDVTINATVKIIEAYAFDGCVSVSEITIPTSVVYVGEGAFFNTGYYNNESNWNGGVLYIGTILIEADSSIVQCDVIKGTTVIACNAFDSCTSLVSVTIPKTVKYINKEAFLNCKVLLKIKIHITVIEIGEHAIGYYIADGVYNKVKDAVIECAVDTAGDRYANENSFGMEYIDPTKDPDGYYFIDTEKMQMPNIPENTSAADIISRLEKQGISAVIKDKNGNIVSENEIVGTGYTIVIEIDIEIIICIKSIVLGDVDGSGTVDSTDYMQIKKLFLGLITLDDLHFVAADTDKDGKITTTDYLQIKNYLLGKYDLYQ